MNDEELKNCPCCGEKAEVDYGQLNTYEATKRGLKPSGSHEVHCKTCGLKTGWDIDSSTKWNLRKS